MPSEKDIVAELAAAVVQPDAFDDGIPIEYQCLACRNTWFSQERSQHKPTGPITRLRAGVPKGWLAVQSLAKDVVEKNGDWMPDGSTWTLTLTSHPGAHYLTGKQLRELAAALTPFLSV